MFIIYPPIVFCHELNNRSADCPHRPPFHLREVRMSVIRPDRWRLGVWLLLFAALPWAGCEREKPSARDEAVDTAGPDNSATIALPKGSPLRDKIQTATVERRPVRPHFLAPASVEA